MNEDNFPQNKRKMNRYFQQDSVICFDMQCLCVLIVQKQKNVSVRA